MDEVITKKIIMSLENGDNIFICLENMGFSEYILDLKCKSATEWDGGVLKLKQGLLAYQERTMYGLVGIDTFIVVGVWHLAASSLRGKEKRKELDKV
jgi:hypothetical protein